MTSISSSLECFGHPLNDGTSSAALDIAMSVDGSFLETLAAAIARVRLDAIVVGNTASGLHGAPVMTEDVDLLVRGTLLNRQKIKQLTDDLGGIQTPLSDLASARRIHFPDVYLDILFDKIGGSLGFNQLKRRSVRVQIGNHSLAVASLQDVIRSKEAAGREKDLAVLPILRTTLATLSRSSKKR